MGRTINLNIDFNNVGDIYIDSVVISNIIMDDMSLRGVLGGDLTIEIGYLGALFSRVLAGGDENIAINYLHSAMSSRTEGHADFCVSFSPEVVAVLQSLAATTDDIEVGMSYMKAHTTSVKYRVVADCTFTIAAMDDMTLRDMYIIEEA